jgi:hypothetical protein
VTGGEPGLRIVPGPRTTDDAPGAIVMGALFPLAGRTRGVGVDWELPAGGMVMLFALLPLP